MFIGEYNHNIDSKGRVILPAKFRDILGDCFYITKGNDGCLFVYTTEGWEKLQEKLSKLPLTNPNARRIELKYGAGKNGKNTIPTLLMKACLRIWLNLDYKDLRK